MFYIFWCRREAGVARSGPIGGGWRPQNCHDSSHWLIKAKFTKKKLVAKKN